LHGRSGSLGDNKKIVDQEEENMKNVIGFMIFGLIHISLEFFKVESKFDPVIVP
jgi:hypothetical protein